MLTELTGDLGPISRKPRKLFGPGKPWQNLEPDDYMDVSPQILNMKRNSLRTRSFRRLLDADTTKKWLYGPGTRFSKLPVITGPVKLFCFPLRMGVSKVLKMVQ